MTFLETDLFNLLNNLHGYSNLPLNKRYKIFKWYFQEHAWISHNYLKLLKSDRLLLHVQVAVQPIATVLVSGFL